MNALEFFLKANLYGLLFASCYWLLFRQHTFVRLNRIYLLLSTVLSLTLPLLSLPSQTPELVPVGLIALPVSAVASAPAADEPNWETTGLIVYSLVAAGLLIYLLVRLVKLREFIRRSPKQHLGAYTLVHPTDDRIPTFSFFRYLIVNPGDRNNTLVINHELAHIQQWHSIDVVALAIVKAVFWACPALWLLDRMLRQVHEFLADKEIHNRTAYALFLVDYTFNLQPSPLANGFFKPSLLKQRIVMLHQKATTRWALGKYIVVIPLAFGLLAMTTDRDKIIAIVRPADKIITVSGQVISAVDGNPLPGANVVIAATGKGTPTDAHGRYTLTGVPAKASLSISFVGFSTQVVSVDDQKVIDVALAPPGNNELPTMGATSTYKAVKPNPTMPVRTPPSSQTINGTVYTVVEEVAVFPTGIPGLMQYIAHSLKYPAQARAKGTQGTVFVEFIVQPTGSISDAKIKKGIGDGCDEEALRVVRQMPRWLPAKQSGKVVTSQFVIPIQFKLEKQPDKRTGYLAPTDGTPGNAPAFRFAGYSIQTRLSPVDTLPKAGAPQRPAPVTIRAKGPLGELGGNPLYILNGVEISPDSMSRVKPENIQSMDVLKGASAASYGEKGRYGVIVITSKK